MPLKRLTSVIAREPVTCRKSLCRSVSVILRSSRDPSTVSVAPEAVVKEQFDIDSTP